MKITALMMVRNEAWVLGLSIRAALMWCDDILVLDHASTDETPAIIDAAFLEAGGQRVKVMRSEGPAWDEMTERQRMLQAARLGGASHMAIVDGDEVLTANLLPSIRQLFGHYQPGSCISVPMVATYHSTAVRRIDGVWGQRSSMAIGFGDRPDLKWAAQADGYQYHARRPQGSVNTQLAIEGMESGGCFHLQFASLERLKAKAAWYKLVETTRWPGRKSPADLNQMYDWTLREGELEAKRIPDEWWAAYGHLMKHLDLKAEPWQAAEARRLYASASPDTFRGLALHGVAG